MTASPTNGLYLAAQVRELDRITIEERGVPGIVLMRRAAEACVAELLDRWPRPGRVAVLCGSGNNAGDGFIIAGLLANRGVQLSVGLVGRRPAPDTDAGAAYQFCEDSGVSITTAAESMHEAALIVDALLGTGITGSVRPDYAEVIESVNRGTWPVMAVDVPSGLSSDTGNILGCAIKADVTVTFIGRKLGLLTEDATELVGELVFSDLGVSDDVYDSVTASASMLDFEELIAEMPVRNRNSHKMSHGHVLIVGGNEGMGGAVIMAAESAMMTGAGLVSVATHPTNVASVLARRPEVMPRGISSVDELSSLLARATVVVLGPGLGRDDYSRMLFKAVIESGKPLVIDADGLNLLSEQPVRRDDWILTPHPGEAARLLGEDVQKDRLNAVIGLQEKYGGVVLLKGAGTLISDVQGVALVPYGNPGMAVAGMGDVLSGVIGSLLAQTGQSLFAAQLGAVLHSCAADNIVAARGERGLLATELAPEMRRLINR